MVLMMEQGLKNQLVISTKNRYKTRDRIGKPLTWRPEYELFWISEKILEWFYNDEFGIIIVHGQQGFGKSCYAAISCAEVYGHDLEHSRFHYNWNAVKKHIVWTPRQFIELSRMQPKSDDKNYMIHSNSIKKEPLVIWDDAGYWLNAMDYRDKLCIQVSKFLEVARTRWGCIIFTVTNQQQLLSKIRNIPHAWSVPIKKPTGTPSRINKRYEWQHDRRFAQLHKSWCSEDLKKYGKKGQEGDIFWARMPDKFYEWYKPMRDSYCDQALLDLDQAASEIGL